MRSASLDRARAALAVGRRAHALAAVRELRGRRPASAPLFESEALVGLLRHEAALGVTRRALLRAAPGDLRARLRLVGSDALRRSGDSKRSASEARRALAEATESLTIARAHEQLAGCGCGAEREQGVETAWSLYASAAHPAGLARVTACQAASLAARGEVEEALALQWRRVELASATTRLDLEAEARCDAGGLLQRLGRWQEAARELQTAAGIFRTLRDPREQAVAGRRGAMADLARGDLAAVRRAVERAERAAGTSAAPALRAELRLLAADLALAEADPAQAEAAAGQALALFVAADSAEGRCRARVRTAHARICLGDCAGGAAEARRALREPVPASAGPPRLAELALGRAALRQGRRAEARAAFERACGGRADPAVAALGRLGLALAGARRGGLPELDAGLRRLEELGERRLARLCRADVAVLLGPDAGGAAPAVLELGDAEQRAALLLEVLRSGGGVRALGAARRHLAWRRIARLDRPGAWLLEPELAEARPLPAGDPLEGLACGDSPSLIERPDRRVVVARVEGAVLAVELGPGAPAGLAPDLLRVARVLVAPPREPQPERGMVAGCAEMRRVLARVEQLAGSGDPVHVCGETGSGKEGIARLLHTASRRAGRCVPVNSAGLSDELFHSELFGHVRGAFSGAAADRQGFVEAAEGGTLFLDEVADLSPRSQARLLRFLETGEYVRLGEAHARRASVRIVSAANVDLEERVRAGAFRADLWYRLAAGVVRLPPLSERGEDIPALARHFLDDAAREWGVPAARLAPDAERALAAWSWPGNVRELRAEMRRASLAAGHGRIRAEHLSIGDRGREAPAGSLRSAQSQNARRVIEAALGQAGGNRTRAAAALGISRQALLARIRRLGL